MGGQSKSAETYLLIETAAGYVLCSIKEWSAINGDTVGKDLADPAKFKQVVIMRGFYPFKDAEQALENITAISESRPTPALLSFISSTIPEKKQKKVKLGVVDSELAKAIVRETDTKINAFHSKDVFEVMRVCRAQLANLIPTLLKPELVDGTASSEEALFNSLRQFQVGLAHSFTRSKIASDPARQDKHCQQAIAAIELADKTANKFGMRMREWYGWHFPELIKIVNDHKKIAQVALIIGRKEEFDFKKGRKQLLAVLDNSEALVDEIENALNMSMGQEISELDWFNIKDAAEQVIEWTNLKDKLSVYLTDKMRLIAPNLQTLVGDQLGGKLITQAGSITALAKAPASTIQILGAEKALFRALKSRGPTPKYGFIYNSGFINKASTKNKGRISRCLANKIALASRMDAFGQEPNFGLTLKKQLEERLNVLTTGSA